MILADRLPPLRPWAEPEAAERAAERAASQKANLRVEVVLHRQAIDQHAVQVAGVTEVAAIAVVLSLQPRRAGARHVASEIDILEKSKRSVGAVHLVVTAAAGGHRSRRAHGADGAAAANVATDAEDREVRLAR